jgi:hypothetical protein
MISSLLQAVVAKAAFFGGAALVTGALFGGVLYASGSLREDVEKVLSVPEAEVILVVPCRPAPPAPGVLVARG